MEHTLQERIIALSGLFLATSQVDRIARSGEVDEQQFETSIRSLLITDPQQTMDVYGTINELRPGIEAFIQQFGAKKSAKMPIHHEIMRYAISLIVLQKKLVKDPEKMDLLMKGISDVQRQVDHFSLTHPNVISRLAQIYRDTVSTIPPKIIVNGKEGYLQQTENSERVRSLLLAGMRAVVLWRQCGGSRWHFLLGRQKYVSAAEGML